MEFESVLYVKVPRTMKMEGNSNRFDLEKCQKQWKFNRTRMGITSKSTKNMNNEMRFESI